MRKAALICASAALTVLSAALAASGGDAAAKPGLHDALVKTARADGLHYALDVRIKRGGTPLALHVHGQASRTTISVRLHMADLKLPNGTIVPGPTSAVLLDGPFLYERAPSSVVVLGKVHWLRLTVARLSSASPDLQAVHAMTPTPLLRVLAEAHMQQVGARLWRGPVAYDDPVVRTALARLTGGIEFRRLRFSAFIAGDGLLHRLLLTGRTADGKTTLSLSARLYAFGRPLHVSPPAPGTFMDRQLAQLGA